MSTGYFLTLTSDDFETVLLSTLLTIYDSTKFPSQKREREEKKQPRLIYDQSECIKKLQKVSEGT